MIKHIFDSNGNALFNCVVLVFYFDLNDGGYLYSDKIRVIKGTGIPCYSTLIAPPEYGDYQKPVFKNNEWVIAEDHRGVIITNDGDKTQYVMNILGPLPEGYVVSTIGSRHG